MAQIAQIYRYCVIIEEQGSELLQALLSDRFYLQTFGALEYLPEFHSRRKEDPECRFREFLQASRCKQVFDFDEKLCRQMKLLYRVAFLKDTVFAKED